MKMPDSAAMSRVAAETLSGKCQCEKCGAMVTVDAARCLRHGWPKCCRQTMTLLPSEASRAD
jgi:hypothetical protein